MIKRSSYVVGIVALIGCFLLAGLADADTLTLKDGQVLQGTFTSRTADGVNFNVGGQVIEFKNANIKSLDLDVGGAPATAPTKQPAETPPAAPAKVTVPAGTKMVVRTNEPIDSKKHKAGHKFTAKLEADLVAEGVIVAPRGSNIYGILVEAKKSRRLAGKSEMTIAFTDLMVNNQMHPISTSQVQAVTEGTGKKTVGRTARAAAIGGLADGSDGARTGAKVGLGVSVLTSGNQINIPAGSMLEVSLAEPFTP